MSINNCNKILNALETAADYLRSTVLYVENMEKSHKSLETELAQTKLEIVALKNKVLEEPEVTLGTDVT